MGYLPLGFGGPGGPGANGGRGVDETASSGEEQVEWVEVGHNISPFGGLSGGIYRLKDAGQAWSGLTGLSGRGAERGTGSRSTRAWRSCVGMTYSPASGNYVGTRLNIEVAFRIDTWMRSEETTWDAFSLSTP